MLSPESKVFPKYSNFIDSIFVIENLKIKYIHILRSYYQPAALMCMVETLEYWRFGGASKHKGPQDEDGLSCVQPNPVSVSIPVPL